MELRRALLLFAIVLGLAAIATSFSRPAERSDKAATDSPQPERSTPAAGTRGTGPQLELISFSETAKPRTERLGANRPAIVTVEVAQPGQVELTGLGLTAAGQPLTPARFEVLESRAGRHAVRFTPATATEARTLGALQIVR